MITGTYLGVSGGGWNNIGISQYIEPEFELSDTLMDKLLSRLMTHTRLVIIPCRYCGCHNAFSNPACIQCGAPMGELRHG